MRSHFLRAAKEIQFIGIAQTQRTTANTDITIAAPSGTQENDLMIACLFDNLGSYTWTGPAGWTEIRDNNGRGVYYRSAAASQGNSTFTCSASIASGGFIVTYRNAAYDAIGSITTGDATVTLSTNNSVVVGVGSRVTAASITFTAAADFILRGSDSDSTAPSWAVFERTRVNSGTTPGTQFNANTGTEYNFLIGIKSA